MNQVILEVVIQKVEYCNISRSRNKKKKKYERSFIHSHKGKVCSAECFYINGEYHIRVGASVSESSGYINL